MSQNTPQDPSQPSGPSQQWYPSSESSTEVSRWGEPPAEAATPAGQQAETGQSGPAYAATNTPPPPYGVAPLGGAAPRPLKQKSGVGKAVAAAAVVSLLVGGIGGYAGYQVAERSAPASSTVGSGGNTAVSIPAADMSQRSDNSVASIAGRMLPTVVSIEVQGGSQADIGSGFIVREDGYILTNNHVVEAAANSGSIDVKFNDASSKPAKIVGTNASYDLAVIKVEATGLPVASIGNSDQAKVGDLVVAVGSPLGYSGTVTSGIVSALNRPVTPGGEGQNQGGSNETAYISAIQTDAAINPGNSGGPLVNAAAEVIGVNSAIATSSSSQSQAGSIGLGFAIPSNTAKRIADEIISGGKADTPIIGINLTDNATGKVDGAAVGQVVGGGPADKAGIKQGDVIVAVNGAPVADSVSLITLIRAKAPGDTVKLTVVTGDQTRTVDVTLGTKTN